jgi:hypothetical protein
MRRGEVIENCDEWKSGGGDDMGDDDSYQVIAAVFEKDKDVVWYGASEAASFLQKCDGDATSGRRVFPRSRACASFIPEIALA